MAVIVLGMIIAIIILGVNNHDLKEEICELKKLIANKVNFCPKCADYINGKYNIQNTGQF